MKSPLVLMSIPLIATIVSGCFSKSTKLTNRAESQAASDNLKIKILPKVTFIEEQEKEEETELQSTIEEENEDNEIDSPKEGTTEETQEKPEKQPNGTATTTANTEDKTNTSQPKQGTFLKKVNAQSKTLSKEALCFLPAGIYELAKTAEQVSTGGFIPLRLC